jgi:xanthine dehydrogenase YagS FAD-binding subunit
VATVSSGKIERIRIALGGVGVRPWRSHEAEAALLGRAPSAEAFRAAAAAAVQAARPQSQNAFKIELAQRCIQHALNLATQSA